MITEFIKDHKRLCIIILVLILIIIALVVINKNSSKPEDVVATPVEEQSMDDMYYMEKGTGVDELDETQSTRYPDINYGVDE